MSTFFVGSTDIAFTTDRGSDWFFQELPMVECVPVYYTVIYTGPVACKHCGEEKCAKNHAEWF